MHGITRRKFIRPVRVKPRSRSEPFAVVAGGVDARYYAPKIYPAIERKTALTQ
jgi:hypothetical protein